MSDIIAPKTLKGFRDFLPSSEISRATLIEHFTNIFRTSGFVPIDTPCLEYSEILLRKSNGETEKQVFRFNDAGGRDVSLRFDLTVPFARFVAEHYQELYFPFKRYHIAKVWRGEKPQGGRFREFVQCDFDIVGSTSFCTDFEILQLIHNCFASINCPVKIHLSHRGIFNEFLTSLSIKENSEEVLRVVDKIKKIGKEEVEKELANLTNEETAKKVLEFVLCNETGSSFNEVLSRLSLLVPSAKEHITFMKEIYTLLESVGIENSFVLDMSITRGLDYYTGVVYETFLSEMEEIGSVCSGGRYDDLTGFYMKEKVSGVGASIGIDRFLAALEMLNKEKAMLSFSNAIIFSNENYSFSYKLLSYFREKGIVAEFFPDNKKMTKQYELAEKKGIKWGIYIEEENFSKIEETKIKLKNLLTREESKISVKDAVSKMMNN
ncbi:MAG: histidine--tRNA ligase [Treponema sp.]